VLFLQVVLEELVGELEVGLSAVHPGKAMLVAGSER
jgi:hypothetical protein